VVFSLFFHSSEIILHRVSCIRWCWSQCLIVFDLVRIFLIDTSRVVFYLFFKSFLDYDPSCSSFLILLGSLCSCFFWKFSDKRFLTKLHFSTSILSYYVCACIISLWLVYLPSLDVDNWSALILQILNVLYKRFHIKSYFFLRNFIFRWVWLCASSSSLTHVLGMFSLS